jgi:hypothetical protein
VRKHQTYAYNQTYNQLLDLQLFSFRNFQKPVLSILCLYSYSCVIYCSNFMIIALFGTVLLFVNLVPLSNYWVVMRWVPVLRAPPALSDPRLYPVNLFSFFPLNIVFINEMHPVVRSAAISS